jgi:hypothetical protein
MAKLKITNTSSYIGQITDAYVSPTLINGIHVGGTGGLTTQTGQQIQPSVKVGTNAASTGNILFQKGAHKFRVQDNASPPNVGTCVLANLALANLTASTMSIQVNTNYLTGVTANAYVASGASTSAFVTWTGIVGPVTPYVGQFVTGLSTVTSPVQITAINTSSNITVGYASQVFSNVAASTANVAVFASRITNKFVYDFGSDGNQIAGAIASSPTYYTNGYNPNKYRYHLATPDSTFVQVVSQ